MRRALAAGVLLASAAAARADLAAGAQPVAPEPGAAPAWSSVALFLGGAATAFAAHEAGHVTANLVLGNTPRLAPVTFAGVVPFFSISPDISCVNGRCFQRDGQPFAAGPHGLFAIVSAGFNVQHVLDEIILTTDPRLRADEAPFRKGMLAFNTLTSVGYVLADWAGVEPPEGDVRSMWHDAGAPRAVANCLLLGAAGLDVARYFFPDVAWLPWASRAVKLAFGGLTFAF